MFGHLIEQIKQRELKNLTETLLNHKEKLRTLAQLYVGVYRNEFEIVITFHCFSEPIEPNKLHISGLGLNDIEGEYTAEFDIRQEKRLVGTLRVLLVNDESDENFRNDVEEKMSEYYELIKQADGLCDYFDCYSTGR
jgi:hypothetical protein